ncbi:nicotinate-nucleotide adenylyltransferase [Virgibacillus xinjiangensis]|uniref:Probable nicotinate-nucleotide adenylyltransferase n=1 Tax=Virgibacillus xinjiangensis TaxID=393090 RepID=A0ABV7CRY9_9BACI
MKRVGILGGTFDPPHIGHLIIAEEVRISLGLEEVWFIPSYTPPHKNEAKSSPEHRKNMLSRAISGNNSFKMETLEIERSGKSYTIDTMQELGRRYPQTEFFFIIGADMVEYLPNWHRIDELIHMVTFAGTKRKGYRLDSPYPVKEVEVPIIDVSSTFIRERIKEGKTVNYFIPESVYAYIKEKELYENK